MNDRVHNNARKTSKLDTIESVVVLLLLCAGAVLPFPNTASGLVSSVHFRGGGSEATLQHLDSCLACVMTSLSEGSLEDCRHCFTDEGYAAFEQLLKKCPVENANPAYLPLLIGCTSSRAYCEARSFRVLDRDDSTALHLVFAINDEDRIVDSWFGTDDTAYAALLDAERRILDEVAAAQIGRLLDKLPHAYFVCDTSYIYDAYSDQAMMARSDLRYEFRTPQQHFDKLRGIYKISKSVRVSYKDIKIEGTPFNDVYSVTLRQQWRSSTYNDDGYLLLAVEFREARPLILMQVWDPLPFAASDVNQWMSRIGPALQVRK